MRLLAANVYILKIQLKVGLNAKQILFLLKLIMLNCLLPKETVFNCRTLLATTSHLKTTLTSCQLNYFFLNLFLKDPQLPSKITEISFSIFVTNSIPSFR